jgi:hypothetical protein
VECCFTSMMVIRYGVGGGGRGVLISIVCRDSSVGIATGYRLGGPGIESR